MMEHAKVKLMVLGLDGATFKVIAPLVEMGKLPHLARLLAEGASGTLTSILPPVTGAAWPVLATGRNPGNLGVYDFVNRRSREDFALHPVHARDFAGHTFWDILSSTGYKVGILNYPMLVPAYHINGWMVSGLGASKLHSYTYPLELKQELDKVTGGYDITISYGLPQYQHDLPLLIADLKGLLRRRVRALEHLMDTRPVDLLVAVFNVSDVALHTMWQYWDPSDPKHTVEPCDKLREEFISIWQMLDAAVGRALGHLASDGHVVVVSDHGFGPSYGVFNMNGWLVQNGYLTLKSTATSAVGNRLREWVVKNSPPFLSPLYKRILGSTAHQALRASVLREIDLVRSKAFALENSDSCGLVYINRHYARLRGLDERAFIRETQLQVKADLARFGNEAKVEVQVFTADELYQGDKVELAPDLLVMVDNLRCSVSYRFEEQVYVDRFHHPLKYGSHRLDGIFIAAGPKIRPGSITEAHLADIAPTVLQLAGIHAPSIMDGCVLAEALKPEFRGEPMSSFIESEPCSSAALVAAQEEETMDTVIQRLKNLGYLD